jgi:hypothetical protein
VSGLARESPGKFLYPIDFSADTPYNTISQLTHGVQIMTYDYDVQGDESTQPSLDTHCGECGQEFRDCDCDTEDDMTACRDCGSSTLPCVCSEDDEYLHAHGWDGDGEPADIDSDFDFDPYAGQYDFEW